MTFEQRFTRLQICRTARTQYLNRVFLPVHNLSNHKHPAGFASTLGADI
jgi:hypothetical protein